MVNPANEVLVETLESERDALRRENRAVQEMLAQVLNAIGEPVFVDKSNMGNLEDGTAIRIDDDMQGDRFVFYLEAPE